LRHTQGGQSGGLYAVTGDFQEQCMYLVGLGLVLLVMKYLELGPVTNLSWIWVLSPFALAVAWWSWADASGYTKKRAMERENARKNARILKNRENTGTLGKSKKR
jgi:small Trp-rich protein